MALEVIRFFCEMCEACVDVSVGPDADSDQVEAWCATRHLKPRAMIRLDVDAEVQNSSSP